jgi:Type II CAAX prenyl endopeptidase Rce1-like
VRELVLPYVRLPLNLGWIAFAILWNFPLIVLAIPLNDWISGTNIVIDRPHWIGFQLISKDIALFSIVALCDELFWIGFVLPRLLAAGYSPVKASLAIGVFWGLSYVPLIFTRFLVSYGLTPESLALSWCAMAPIYIWLYFRTRSALAVIIMCVSMQFSNWTLPVLPQPPDYDNSDVAMLNLLTFAAGLLLWRFFPPRAADDAVSGVSGVKPQASNFTSQAHG